MRIRIWWSENLGSTAESCISLHLDFVESYLFSFFMIFFSNCFLLVSLMLRKYHEINTSICKIGCKRGSDSLFSVATKEGLEQ